MKITSFISKSIQYCRSKDPIITKRIYRIAMNALIIGNCCLVTTLFFVASKVILSIALTISIIGSSILIDRCYKI